MSKNIPSPPPTPNLANTETTLQTNTTNNIATNNVTSHVVNNEDLPQLRDSRGENGVFVPKSPTSTLENVLTKPQKQWSLEDIKLVNQDKRLKSIIILCLPNDIMKSVIKCTNAKSMWNDLILGHEGSFETRDTKIVALRLKFNVFKALEGEKVQ
ncbi:hypothetical protein Tco_0328863 [Tanacetum coccineum]